MNVVVAVVAVDDDGIGVEEDADTDGDDVDVDELLIERKPLIYYSLDGVVDDVNDEVVVELFLERYHGLFHLE